MNGPMNGPSSLEFQHIQSWADPLGFLVQKRTQAGKTVYTVIWSDLQSRSHTAEITDLTELPDFITRLIESGQARQPGVFYIGWSVHHLSHSYWCRTRSWVHVTVWEGAPPPSRWITDRIIDGFDPTPYASAQEAIDTAAFIGLEFGARLGFYADFFDIRSRPYITEYLPTASYSPAALEEQIGDLIRHCAYRRIHRYDKNDTDYVARELLYAGFPANEVRQAVQRMVAEGRLVREWQQEPSPWRRWLRRWRSRRRLCFTEPGWECELVSCENCGRTGTCPTCKGSGWQPDQEAHPTPSPCRNCSGRIPPGGFSESHPGNGYCLCCGGEGKVGQWRQK